ncbi:MAG: putative bifunctional diguanylate cyclase/phosphodiesterase [Gammaproteobacteria bacterium]
MTAVSATGALDQILDAVIVTDAGLGVRYLNKAARLYAGDVSELPRGVALGRVLPVFDAGGRRVFATDLDNAFDPTNMSLPLTLRVANHAPRQISLTVSREPSNAGGGWTMVLRDQSRETGLEQRLAHQSTHDSLTQLPNREVFENSVALALQACRENQDAHCAVLYLDIDLFQIINDTSGHAAGDQVLRSIAAALRTRIRDTDMLARLGGDEFGVLLHACTLDQARDVAGELQTLIRNLDFIWHGKRYAHTVSIGVALIRGDSASVSDVLSAADVACYAAKDRGRDRVEEYGHGDGPERQEQMHWVTRVMRACDEQRFVLYQQPIAPLQKSAAVEFGARPHYELLLRMVGRQGKVIMPAEFIHAAERYNIMPRVDRWTVRHVLEELVWREDRAPQQPYMLSVNLSGTSLSDASFRQYVRDLLDQAPVAPNTLCFEITETAAIGNVDQVAHFMHELHERRCLFSLDDFGTGMASFAYLKDLPVDFLKIDGHFTHQLATDPTSASMIRAFHEIGSALNIRTVAERVEDERTALILAELGVDFAQGYHFARPRKLLNRLAFEPVHADKLPARVAV